MNELNNCVQTTCDGNMARKLRGCKRVVIVVQRGLLPVDGLVHLDVLLELEELVLNLVLVEQHLNVVVPGQGVILPFFETLNLEIRTCIGLDVENNFIRIFIAFERFDFTSCFL